MNSIDLILGNTIDVKASNTKGYICKRCRTWTAKEQNELCNRCEKIMENFYSK